MPDFYKTEQSKNDNKHKQIKFTTSLKEIKHNNDPQHKLLLKTSDGNAECCLFYSGFQVFTTKRS